MALLLFSNLPKQLLLLILFIVLGTPTVKSQDADYHYYMNCPNDKNYTANSTFKTNLDHLLTSLYSNASLSGFSNLTVGKEPDQVYGLVLCRGDLSLDVCRTCLSTAINDTAVNCPKSKYLDIWRNYCYLRYSNSSFFGYSDEFYYVFLPAGSTVKEPQLFSNNLGELIENLSNKAAYQSSLMFAVGSTNYTSFGNIYGMVQCTRDISNYDCFRCLTKYRSEIPKCCNASSRDTLAARNCIIRYDLTPFYNVTAVNELSSSTPPVTPPPTKKDSSPTPASANGATKSIAIVVLSVVAVLALVSTVMLFYFRRRKPVRSSSRYGQDRHEFVSSEFRLFDLATLNAATNNFSDSNKLGQGGFGLVYKGTLEDYQEIAVKRLSGTSVQGLIELKNEVVLLVPLQHKNLVRLLGCCIEEKEKLLVYEYLPNKSLDKFLFDSSRRRELDWGMRYKIIEGIGRGLLYLHEDSRVKIVHHDLKTSNILLDEDMVPKISDFGLAKLFDVDETQKNTSRIAGTFGYMAPEYALHGLFSAKSDVYSFGVIMLEILTGRKNICHEVSGQLVDLLSYVWEEWTKGTVFEVMDSYLVEYGRSQDMLKCIHIGLLCVQEEPSERPSMASVILMLNSSSLTLSNPKPPSSFIRGGLTNESNILEREASSLLES